MYKEIELYNEQINNHNKEIEKIKKSTSDIEYETKYKFNQINLSKRNWK